MKYRYAEMTWPEIKEAAAQQKVAVLPVAIHEDHGPHLPVDTDILLCGSICERSAARLVPYWSSRTASGVNGDATRATKEKGEKFLEAGITGLIDLIRELKNQPILPRRDQH